MDIEEKRSLLEASLERAAEAVGDITQPVMELFYRRFPEAGKSFEELWPGNRDKLEAEMVERALYCLMYWFQSPGEIEILLSGSVMHHNDTLKVPPEWYSGLIEATAEVIVATIPADQAGERAVWEELRRNLSDLVEQSRQFL